MRPSDAPLISAEAIARRVSELARAISRDFAGVELVVIPVLKGALHFASDLLRHMTIPVTLDLIQARSYLGGQSSGNVEVLMQPAERLEGRIVLVVDDVLDTGRTTAAVIEQVEKQAPAEIRLATLLNKPARRVANVQADYIGFEIDDVFVVGYGLDYNEQYRELPAIHVLEGLD